jgi:hypothetical protein
VEKGLKKLRNQHQALVILQLSQLRLVSKSTALARWDAWPQPAARAGVPVADKPKEITASPKMSVKVKIKAKVEVPKTGRPHKRTGRSVGR